MNSIIWGGLDKHNLFKAIQLNYISIGGGNQLGLTTSLNKFQSFA